MNPQLILVNWHDQAVNLTDIFSSEHFGVFFANNPEEAAKAVTPSTFLALWDARGKISQTLANLSMWEAAPDLARPPLLLVVRADEVTEILSERPELDLAFMHPAQLSARVSQYLALFEQRTELKKRHKSEARLRQDLALDRQNRETAQRLMSENERALSRIFEPMETHGEAIILANINAVTYYTNPAFQKLTGLDSKAAFGTPAIEVLDLNNPPLPFEDILAVAREAGPWRDEVQIGTHQREPRNVHLEVDAIKGTNGEFEGYFFIIRDIGLLRHLVGSLQALAQLDLVTQLYTRVYFLERLEAECARAKRYGNALTLIMLDIDHFRKINLQQGHVAGDSLLAGVGGHIRRLIRNTDFAARHDGDRFSIALTDTDAAGGRAFAERLFNEISQQGLEIHGEVQLDITYSTGLASYENKMESAQDFFNVTETALTKAMAAGGGQLEEFGNE